MGQDEITTNSKQCALFIEKKLLNCYSEDEGPTAT